MGRYQRSGRGSKIDWGRTILHCAIFIVILSVIQMVLGALGFGASGLLILCLGIIAWYFLPGIIRNIKIKHHDKAARKRDPVEREELLDFDD
jgi:hypothetical protein